MLQKRKQNLSYIQNFLSPENPWAFIGYLGLSTLTGALSTFNPWALLISAILAFVWFIEVEWNKRSRAKDFESWLNDTIISFIPAKQKPVPSSGLILLLSPYSPRKQELKQEDLRQSIDIIIKNNLLTQKNFDDINLLGSNLAIQLAAIDFHCQQKTLRDIWLISTKTDETGEGSESTIIILKKYLEFKYPNQITVHHDGLTVSDNNYYELYQMADRIFRDSKNPYKDEHIIADITGGNKMMSIALALACIPRNRKLQYMDSHRDWQGNPIPQGEKNQPILIDIDPIVHDFPQ